MVVCRQEQLSGDDLPAGLLVCMWHVVKPWSAAHQNDETLLVIDSPQLAEHFTAEINRLWKGAELGITPRLQRKQERQRNRCGSGVQRS